MLTDLLLVALLAQSTDEHSAVVSGRVIDAGTGHPIAGVVVTPAGSAVPPPLGPVSNPVIARVLTNGEGWFVVRGLRTGSLVLTATKGGYADATYGQRRPGGSTQPIPIKDDGRVSDLQIRMWKHAAITGTIVDDAGEPAVATRVTAYMRGHVAGQRRFAEAASAETDDRGVYRIAGLTPGDYVVAIESTGTLEPVPLAAGGAIVFPSTFYPAAPAAAQAAIVTLASGDERVGVDIQAHAVRAVHVSGTLIAGGSPPSFTIVRLLPAAADELIEPRNAAATVTDVSGSFIFPAVPPGDYLLEVARPPRPDAPSEPGTRVTIAPGTGAATVSGAVSTSSDLPAPTPIPPDATLCAEMPVTVGERAIDNLVVPLGPGPRLTGRVEFDGASGQPTGPTLATIRIFLDPADGSRLPDRTLALFTGHPDENGEFATYGVPPGRYVVGVGGPPAGWFLESVTYQGRDISDTPIELGTKDATGVVITYTDRPARIAGSVAGPQGPASDSVVLVYPTDQDAWAMSGSVPRRMRTARVKPSGDFAIAGLPAGDYYVVAVREEGLADWQDPALLQALTRVAQQVTVNEGESKAVSLSAAEIR
jgi:hypothetical protein